MYLVSFYIFLKLQYQNYVLFIFFTLSVIDCVSMAVGIAKEIF